VVLTIFWVVVVRGPQGQIVSEKLHDQSRIFIAFFGKRIELSDGIIEGGLGESEDDRVETHYDVTSNSRAGVLWVVQNFVVENGVIKSKTKSDWVGWRHVRLCDIEGGLISFLGALHDRFSVIAAGNFGQVSVVVTLHFEVEDFGLASRRLGDKMSVQQVENDLADVAELNLDLLSIFLSNGEFLLAMLALLLDGADDSPA